MFSCFIQVSGFGGCLLSQDKVGTVQLQNHFPYILLEVASDELQLLDPAEGLCRQDLQVMWVQCLPSWL